MSYRVLILPRAQKELAAIPNGAYQRVRDAILKLADNPRPPGCVKLTNRDGWRVRVGDYRVIYEIDDSARRVLVMHVGDRRDVYR